MSAALPDIVWPGHHLPRGATYDGTGTNLAVWAPAATAMWVCLFDDDGVETRLPLPERTFGVWHGYVPGIGAGQSDVCRPDGLWDRVSATTPLPLGAGTAAIGLAA